MIVLECLAAGVFFAVVAIVGGLMSIADILDRHRRMNSRPPTVVIIREPATPPPLPKPESREYWGRN